MNVRWTMQYQSEARTPSATSNKQLRDSLGVAGSCMAHKVLFVGHRQTVESGGGVLTCVVTLSNTS